MDNNNSSTGSISLQFGQSLNKILKFDQLNNRFDFNADVLIQGILNLTGNRLNFNSTAGSDIDVFIVANQNSSAGGTIKYNSGTQKWEISSTGSVFSEIATISTSQELSNKIIDANKNQIINLP